MIHFDIRKTFSMCKIQFMLNFLKDVPWKFTYFKKLTEKSKSSLRKAISDTLHIDQHWPATLHTVSQSISQSVSQSVSHIKCGGAFMFYLFTKETHTFSPSLIVRTLRGHNEIKAFIALFCVIPAIDSCKVFETNF